VRLLRCWLEVLRAARSAHRDIVVIDSDIYFTVAALAVLILTLLPGCPPVVFICHNPRPLSTTADGELEGFSRMQTLVLRRLIPRLRLTLLHGESSRAEFDAAWPQSRTATIPHGDERLFAEDPPPPAERESILFFGNWHASKGIPVLTEAFDLIASRRPEATLTIAGTPFPDELDPAELNTWAIRHDGRVELIERYLPIDEVPDLFGRARVVAVPYLHASQSGVAHLAMTLARPVVASDVGDLPSIVADGETGLLVPPADPAALAAALERLLADPRSARRMGEAGRERVLGGSSWENVAERFDHAVSAALDRGGSAQPSG
jgi:glycosyltransferase involved in cell wall biosynthesis